jgi:hypothetical protein
MPPKHLKFGGGTAGTILNPAVLLVILIVGMIILFRPRRKVIAPFIVASILIPMDQVLVIGGLHFPMLRLLALFGIVRLIREKVSKKAHIFSGGITKIDIAVISFAISTAIAGVLLFRESGAVIFQFGEVYSVFGLYFLFRFLIRDREDVGRMIWALALIAPIIAGIMFWEVRTGTNPYAMLGGARSSFYANLMERDNRFRAVGCFGGPITAGTFGAIVAPLFVLLWREHKKYRVIAALGITSTLVIILTANSSTPILAYVGGIVALCLWPLRNWMRTIRWGIVAALLCVHMVWNHPVWYLIAKVDISGGSSSWHRFALIDQCVRHFGDWWLVGVKSTAEWGWDMWDTANQYVGVCDSSGLLSFVLFMAILVYGFKYLGRARKRARSKKEGLFFWALGASLFANVVSFFGISYWDQTQVVWYGLLAAISAVAVIRSDSHKAPVKDTRWAGDPLESGIDVESDAIAADPSIRVGRLLTN